MSRTPFDLRLRPIRADDGDLLFRVYASTRDEELALVGWDDEEKAAFLRFQFAAQTSYWDEHYPDAQRSVIEVDGSPAGRLYLDRRPDEIRIVDIALLPEHRGRGIGSRLLEEVLEEAAGGGRVVRIHVETSNPALGLYRRLGFREIGDRGVYRLLEWRREVAG